MSERWNNKYIVDWCHLCDSAVIICPQCHNSSCSGGACSKCSSDFDNFNKSFKTRVQDYLTLEEALAYEKGLTLQRIIIESIRRNEASLDFPALKKAGYFSEYDEKMFLPA